MNSMFQLKISVYFPNGFHVGAGYGDYTLIDTVQRRRANSGVPIIPATAVKGRLRYVLERMTSHGAAWTSVSRCRKDEGACDCPVCQLFGNAYQRGVVRFFDMEPADPLSIGILPTHTGIVMDRRRGVAKQDMLYTYEYMVPATMHTQMEGMLPMRDGLPDELLWLAMAAINLDAFGGKKTVGKGRVEGVTINQLEFQSKEWKDEWQKEVRSRWQSSTTESK